MHDEVENVCDLMGIFLFSAQEMENLAQFCANKVVQPLWEVSELSWRAAGFQGTEWGGKTFSDSLKAGFSLELGCLTGQVSLDL